MTRTGSARGLGVATLVIALMSSAPAWSHPERSTQFPDPALGATPELRTDGRALVVCTAQSRERVRRFRGRLRARNLRLLDRCAFRSIQAAVDAASSGDRILVLPGRYTEPRSRAAPMDDPRCRDDYETTHEDEDPARSSTDPTRLPTYEHHLKCPNAHNLIAIIGDTDGDRRCDRRCNLQLEGTGRRPSDVLVVGDRRRRDVIRADRADGIVIVNLAVEQGAYNGIDVVETNGYRLERLIARWNEAYGILSFTSDHGLYDTVEAYGNGDSGVYPGSAPKTGCTRHGVELRHVDSHHNLMGYSGTAANSVWVHDSRFHHNAVGFSTDSAVPHHPGHPQECDLIEDNDIYSNNFDLYDAEHDATCRRTPFERRRREYVCPQFAVPLGTGLAILGGNGNAIRNNRFWDNWRAATRLMWMPAFVREELDPAKLFDTSHGNRFTGNAFGIDAGGRRDPNGLDVSWDEEGRRNCWEGNRAFAGGALRTEPASLPACPGPELSRPPAKPDPDVLCLGFDREHPDPPGCSWVVAPREPQ